MSTNFLFSKVCFAFLPQANFPALIWIFTEGEGDGIKSRLPFKIFSTLREKSIKTKKKMFARIAIRLLCIKVCYNFMFVTQFLKRQGSNALSVISHIPKVIYERELTTKLLTNREFQGCTLSVYVCSLLSNTQFIRK